MKSLKYFCSVLFLILFPISVLAGNCTCNVIANDGSSMGSDRECKRSRSECYQWCDSTYNPSGIFNTTISYGSGECSAKCGNIYIRKHTEFQKGHKWSVCTKYKVIFQEDGNLVVYNPKGKAVWSSKTNNMNAEFLAMQSDGNLVIYNKETKPVWASNTSGNKGAVLAIQDDGNVVIYNSSEKAIRSTGTHGQ